MNGGGFRWVTDARYAVLGVMTGAAVVIIAYVTMLVGLLPVGLVVAYLTRRSGTHGWSFVAGLMIGAALCVVPALSPALTNHDPAVSYDASTVPVLIAAAVLGIIGVAMIAARAIRASSHR